MAQVEWSKRALKQLLSVDTRYQQAISRSVTQLAQFPTLTKDVKKLTECGNLYRLRVGNYRVLFEIIQGKPIVCQIQAVKRRTSKTY
jgi:mRNA interferase RelE/StbE